MYAQGYHANTISRLSKQFTNQNWQKINEKEGTESNNEQFSFSRNSVGNASGAKQVQHHKTDIFVIDCYKEKREVLFKVVEE